MDSVVYGCQWSGEHEVAVGSVGVEVRLVGCWWRGKRGGSSRVAGYDRSELGV